MWTGATADTPTEPSVAAGEITLSSRSHLGQSELTNRGMREKRAVTQNVTLEAINGSLVAVQTSGNS